MRHGLDGVLDQVGEHLADLIAVCQDGWEAFELRAQLQAGSR